MKSFDRYLSGKVDSSYLIPIWSKDTNIYHNKYNSFQIWKNPFWSRYDFEKDIQYNIFHGYPIKRKLLIIGHYIFCWSKSIIPEKYMDELLSMGVPQKLVNRIFKK